MEAIEQFKMQRTTQVKKLNALLYSCENLTKIAVEIDKNSDLGRMISGSNTIRATNHTSNTAWNNK